MVCVLVEMVALSEEIPRKVLIGRAQLVQASHLATPSVTSGQGGSMCSLLHLSAIREAIPVSSSPALSALLSRAS